MLNIMSACFMYGLSVAKIQAFFFFSLAILNSLAKFNIENNKPLNLYVSALNGSKLGSQPLCVWLNLSSYLARHHLPNLRVNTNNLGGWERFSFTYTTD